MASFRQLTATTTVQQLVSFNEARRTLLVQNDGDSKAFISLDRGNVTTTGQPVQIGGFISFIADEGDDPRMALYVQTESGTADIRVAEGFRKIPRGE